MSADKKRCLSDKDLDRWTHQPVPAEQAAKIQDHVRGCESCQERVQGEQLFSDALREALCPSDAELALWAEGQLPLNRARKVQDHISSCDDCSDVAELTTEANEWLAAQAVAAQSSSRERSNTKRRRSATRRVSPVAGPQPASAPGWLVWAAPAAAAALLMVLFSASPSRERSDRSASLNPPQNPGKNPDRSPSQNPDSMPLQGPGAGETPINPRPPIGADPETPGDANPKPEPTNPHKGRDPREPIRPEPETSETPVDSDPRDPTIADPAEPKAGTGAGTEVRKNPASARAGLQVAMATGKLSSRQGSGSWTRLSGAAELSAEHEIAARGGHGAMTFASVDLSLRDGAALRLERDDESEACLELSSGEALFSVRPAARRFVARVGQQRITALGTRFLVRQRKGSAGAPGTVEVAVEEGQVELSNPQGKILVSAGEAAQAENGRAPQRLPSVAVDRGWIEELIDVRLQSQGLSYPRAVLALAALEALQPELSRGADSQAAVLFSLRGLLSDPSLALLAPTTLAPRLDQLAAELGASELSAEARSNLVLAQCIEAWSLVGARKSSMKTLSRRAPEAAARLLSQSQKVLAAQRSDWRSIAALRLAERFGLEIASPEAWTKLAEQLASSEAPNLQDGLALLLLPRKTLRSPSKALSARLRAAESLAEAWLEDASLPPLEAQVLCSVLARSSAANRFEGLLSRLVGASAPSAADQLLVLSRAIPLLMEGALPRLEESAGPKVLRDGKDYIVAFEFKPASFQKQVFLCGDWDQWVETSSPMSRDRDGIFRLKKRFASGKHQYKFRNGDADANWFTDPLHPITIDNGHGGLNSLLVLP